VFLVDGGGHVAADEGDPGFCRGRRGALRTSDMASVSQEISFARQPYVVEVLRQAALEVDAEVVVQSAQTSAMPSIDELRVLAVV